MKRAAKAARLAVLALAASAHAADSSESTISKTPSPLPVERALKAAEINHGVPIQFSPDGRFLAYTVQEPSRIETIGDPRHQAIPRTGAAFNISGCDVWIVDVETGQARNLTGGKGSSWGPAWSPNGRSLAFLSDRDGLARIWLWDSATGELRRISEAVVRTVLESEVARFSPDGSWIVTKILPDGMTLDRLRDLSIGPSTTPAAPARAGATATVFRSGRGTERPETSGPAPSTTEGPAWVNINRADLAAIDVATGSVRRLRANLRPRGYWFSPDGTELAFTDIRGWAENAVWPTYDLYVVSLSDGRVRSVGRRLDMTFGFSVSWSPDGKSLAYLRSGQANPSQIVVVDASDGRERISASAQKIEAGYPESPPVWDPEGRAVYVTGENTLEKVEVASGKSKTLLSLDGVLLNVVGRPDSGRYWSPDGGRSLYLAYQKAETKRSGFLRVDLSSGQSRTLVEQELFLPRGSLSTDVSPDGRRVVFSRQNATRPEDFWIAGRELADRRQLTHINPALEGYPYGQARLVEWTAGGERLRGALLLPAGFEPGKRYPLIVNVYGGSSRSDSLFRFGLSGSGVENMQLLATRGFAMLLPDTPIDKSRNAPMAEIARAVLPGVDKVVEMGIADPDRLGVMGHSYGGYSTLALIVQTTRFQAAMASASFSNLITMYGMFLNGNAGSVGYIEEGQGGMGDTPWKVRDRYFENSPFFFLDRVQTPLLLVHGSLDQPRHAEETFVALRRLGKTVEFARYEGEGHWQGSWGLVNQVDYWNRMIAWFDEHLNGSSAN